MEQENPATSLPVATRTEKENQVTATLESLPDVELPQDLSQNLIPPGALIVLSMEDFVAGAVAGTSLGENHSTAVRNAKVVLEKELYDPRDIADLERSELAQLGIPKGLCAKLIRHARKIYQVPDPDKGTRKNKRKRKKAKEAKLYTPDKNLATTQQTLSNFAVSLNHDPQDFVILSENEVLCKLCDSSLRLHRPFDLYAVKRHILGSKKFQDSGKRTNHYKKFMGRAQALPHTIQTTTLSSGDLHEVSPKKSRTDASSHFPLAALTEVNPGVLPEVENERLALNNATGVLHCWCLEHCPVREATSQKGRKFVSCMRCHFFSWLPVEDLTDASAPVIPSTIDFMTNTSPTSTTVSSGSVPLPTMQSSGTRGTPEEYRMNE